VNLAVKGDFIELSGYDNLSIKSGTKPSVTFKDIDVKGATEICLQIVNGVIGSTGRITGGNSKNITVNVYGSLGNEYTTYPVGILNLKENTSDMIFISTGFYLMKFEIINNDVARTSTVNYKILLKF
jgi:hypothetical protein